MNKKTKAFLYNFLGFTPIFLLIYFTVARFSRFDGFWVPLIAGVVSTIIAPKFQAIKVHGDEKIFMKWLFIKGVKEVK